MYHPQPSTYIPPAGFAFDFVEQPASLAPPPSVPSHADLFSASETTDLFGFLDGFANDPTFAFEFPPDAVSSTHYIPTPPPTYLSTQGFAQDMYALAPQLPQQQPQQQHPHSPYDTGLVMRNSPHARMARLASSSPPGSTPVDDEAAKALLSTPQKRLNHIMSEQKRRNAIRDGYATLIGLLAPAGSQCAIAMPSRGRPKGSGGRARNKTQGKSGVLFRAVEYIAFLEEGRDALAHEVARLERMAGIASPQPLPTA